MQKAIENQIGPSLINEIQTVANSCDNCGICQKDCTFLQQFGTPGEIARTLDTHQWSNESLAFKCSLCQLCKAVCPKGVDPYSMFHLLRRQEVERGGGDFSQHAGIRRYEQRGVSRRFTYYALPKGCETVLFPGCTFPGTRPETTKAIFATLRNQIPEIGMVLDCCAKPSLDLGQQGLFESRFNEMKAFLVENGVKRVLTTCPNCQQVFSNYGGHDLVATMVYEILAKHVQPKKKEVHETLTIHDPCVSRFDSTTQNAVRKIVNTLGHRVIEMPHHGEKTLCCGEGGQVIYLDPDITENWKGLRSKETGGYRVVTYCAGCDRILSRNFPTVHVLDLMIQPEKAATGRISVAKAPLTYMNRLRLKEWLQKKIPVAINRERSDILPPKKDVRMFIRSIAFAVVYFATAALLTLSGIFLNGLKW